MSTILEKVTISSFRKNITKFTQDPETKVLLKLNGKPIGVYMGIEVWRTMQEPLDLLANHPQELLKSLVLHRKFHDKEKPIGISLNEFEASLEKHT